MSNKAHHILPDERRSQKLKQEGEDVLAQLANLPTCPDCGKDYSHPRVDGFTLYRVPCGCEIKQSGVEPKEKCK